MKPASCLTCRHWTCHDDHGTWSAVGTCAKGGPTPDDGCSDTHRDEVCERYAPKEQAK